MVTELWRSAQGFRDALASQVQQRHGPVPECCDPLVPGKSAAHEHASFLRFTHKTASGKKMPSPRPQRRFGNHLSGFGAIRLILEHDVSRIAMAKP